MAEREWPAGTPLGHEGAIEHLLRLGRVRARSASTASRAVGHRVVHGGDALLAAGADRRRDAGGAGDARSRWRRCTSRTTSRRSGPSRRRAPSLPQVACFDTAFHGTQPPVAQAFALPRRYAERGRAPLRLSRPLVRVHRVGAARARAPAAARGPHRRRPPRQRREHVRAGARAERRHDDGLHRARRPRDGDPLRLDRSRRPALPDGSQHGMDAARPGAAPLRAVGPAGRLRRVQRHARAAGPLRRAPPPRRWSCSSTASLASSARSRRRWAGSTRWSSPAASARTPRRSARASAGTRAGSGWSSTRRPTHEGGPASAGRAAGRPRG